MKRVICVVSVALLLTGCGIFGGGEKKSKKTPVLGERVPILVYEPEAQPDPELADVTISLPSPQANDSWTQPGGNAAKNMGHLTIGTAGTQLSQAWSVSIGKGSTTRARLAAGPAIAEGRIYTIDTQAQVRAFDARTGRLQWNETIGADGEVKSAAFGGGVSYGNGRIYAATGWGRVVSFEAATGKQLWNVTVSSPIRGAPAVDGEHVVVITQDNQIFALSATSGQTLWQSAGTVETSSLFGAASPAIALDTVVAGFSSGELTAMRIENSRPVWQDALNRTGAATSVAMLSDVDASPAIDQGRVFAIGEGGRMAAIELSTGQRVWEDNIGGISTPWVAGDWVYVVTSDSRLLCLSRSTGKVRWATQLPQYKNQKKKEKPIRWYGPVLASEGLFLTGTNGRLMSVSPYTGKIASETKMSSDAHLPPVVANNMLYVLTDNGKLTAWH